MASFNSNKQLKEEFVSNLTGSSFIKILALLSFVPILSEWVYIGSILAYLLFFITAAAKRYGSPPELEYKPHSFRTFLSSYRVCTMLITCFCILAVDFRIFPRENAKTETYGTSVMDLGVGSFVFANAIISRQARNISSTNWKTAIKSTSPLILLGLGRIVSTTGVDYQVHVGEYGVHWNFFFTLAAISILTSMVNVSPKYCGILGSAILVGYQSWLSCGLNVYLLSNARGTDIISQNKEGIFSIFGYWGLYLVVVWLGHYIFFEN